MTALILKRDTMTLCALLAAMSVAACGGAKPANQQYRGVLPVPEFPSDPTHPFLLTDGENTVNFNSSLIFWDKTPAPEQVQAILEHTHGARIIKSKALVELGSQVIPDKEKVASSRARYESYNAKINAASGDVDKVGLRGYVSTVADSFFSSRIGELAQAGLINEADTARAQTLWPAYCEAKLWELAANPQLGRDFLARPTPLAMCEGYYAAQNYFADATLCGPSADASGKNYFLCIWREGLLKSSLFAESYKQARCTPASSPYASRFAAIEAWLGSDGGILRATLTAGDAGAAALERAILLGDLIDRKASSFKDCRGAFTRKEPAITNIAEIPDWTQFKPETLLQIGEMSETSSADAWRLIALSASDDRNKAVYSRLTRIIKAFGERPDTTADIAGARGFVPPQASAASDVEGARIADVTSLHGVPSYSDTIFNQVTGTALSAKRADIDIIEADPAFAGLADFQSATVKQLKAEQAQALAAWNAAVTAYDAAKSHYEGVSKPAIDNNRLSTVDVVKDRGAAVFLNNYFLNVTKVGGELRVQLGFDLATQNLYGCVTIIDGTPCPVSSEQLGTNGAKLEVKFDSGANLVTVKFPLDDPTALGFPDLPRTPGGVQFNEMPLLKGRFVQIENYGNELPGDLRIITGNAYVLDEVGNKLYTGSITGDNFAQREQSLTAAYQN